jgi:hypothetical protein
MIKRKLSIIIIFCLLLANCEELEEYVTNVRGKVYADNCEVVIAVKGESELFSYLNDIEGIDHVSLRDAEIIRGFDISIENDSLYDITMGSFGETYFLAVVDDGLTEDVLDTLDHVGFYGESDNIDVPLISGGDTTFIYSVPEKMNIQDRVDENDVDIRNFIEYRWFIIIYQLINQ